MENVDLNPSVKYEGSIENQINPNHIQERQRVIDGIRFDSIRNRDIHYAQSPHFIVVFKDNKPYLDFDAPTMEGPEDLAYYLEGGLKIATDTFELEPPDTFQVLQVKRGGRFMSLVQHGLHYGNRMGQFKFEEWDHARFSKVSPRGKSKALFTPTVYTVALHEAIGHGYLAPALLAEEAQLIPFLNEGLSTYIEYVASGRNPHDYLRMEMFQHGLDRFQNIWGKWKNMTDEQIRAAIAKKTLGSSLSVRNTFKLTRHGEDVARRSYTSVRNGFSPVDYSKGGSFIKYFIDRFGIEAFKKWAAKVDRKNFVASMEEITGVNSGEIEQGWKEEVLNGFMMTPQLTSRLEGVTLEEQVQRHQEMTRIRDIYETHA